MNESSFSSLVYALFLALMIERHAFAVIVGQGPGFVGLISILAFLGSTVLFILKMDTVTYKLTRSTFFFSILTILLFLYGALSTFINGENQFGLLIELFALVILFFIGRSLSPFTFRYMVYFCISVSTALSIILILDRGYVFSSGINYLLVSIPIGLGVLLSLCLMFSEDRFLFKVFLLVCCLISFVSLFYLQSRAVFLSVVIFSFFIYMYSSKNNFLNYKNLLFLFFLILLMSYKSEYLIVFYEDSSLFYRLDALFAGTSHEPRSELYSSYFSHLNEFYFSGFGLGGTEAGLYSNTIEKYPHNLVLEFWSEFGVLGLVFSLSLLFFAFKRKIYLLINSPDSLILVVLYLFFLMNFMKSFSIYQSSVFFFALGLIYNEKLCKVVK